MKKFKNISISFLSLFASFAFVCGVITSNSACGMIFHQPKEPEEMNKFKI